MRIELQICSFIFLFFVKVDCLIVEREWKIYYDLSTNQTIDIIDSTNPRLKIYKHKTGLQKLFRLGFGPIPCSCQSLVCGCCAGMNIAYFNFNQRACLNFTYDPYEFALKMNMIMNEESLYENSVSGKNPPPACMPVPVPYLPSIDLCVRFFNIHTPGYKVFMCMDFETRIERAPILVLHFDCMSMGTDGISYHKPEDSEYGPEIEDADTNPGIQNEEQEEIYDEVYEEGHSTKVPPKMMVQGLKKNETRVQEEEVYDEVFENDNITDTRQPEEKPDRWIPVTNPDEVYDEITEEKKTLRKEHLTDTTREIPEE